MNKPPDHEIARIIEFGEAEAFADMYAAAPPELGLRVEHIGSAFVFIAPRLPMILFNRVVGLGLKEPATEAIVADISALYTAARVPTFAVQLPPFVQPSELPAWLEARGMLRRDNWSKVYHQPNANIRVPTDLRIEQVGPERAEECACIAGEAFEMPPFLLPWLTNLVGREGWQHYLAFDGETAVGTGAIFMREGVAWVSLGGTKPSHRKRGSQGEIMARRIRDAAASGCDWVFTETDEDTPEHPNPSYHNMLRTGFTLAYPRRNYIFEAESHKLA